jgi:hypothetical protein
LLKGNNCAEDYVNYGQIATGNSNTDQQSALANLDRLPYFTGSGKTTQIPLELTNPTVNAQGVTICNASNAASSQGCPNNGANFGSVTGTIGGNRAVTMALHITF